MLVNAMNAFQQAKRAHNENVKNQYLDKTGKTGAKDFTRASEMGSADRKIVYGFFAHQIPHDPKSSQNLRQLENGDYVHDRYQTAWQDMGILLSMEERLSSKDDEYLAQFPWEHAGHYDGLLDVNIIRAFALGKAHVSSEPSEEEEGKWEIVVELDDEYAQQIGIFDEDYAPVTMVADIKTMNPWGFKKIKDNKDVSNIQGYIDQISFYMYMLNTPYGSIYIEAKDNQSVLEVQIVWRDMHEGIEYGFEEDIHGKQNDDVVRVVIDSERFFGGETTEGVVPRIDRLHKLKEALRAVDETNDWAKVTELMPERCAETPDKFPCSWKTGRCEFYEHCWNPETGGKTLRPFEAVPSDVIWEFHDEDSVIKVDSRKVPEGVTYDGFAGLVNMNVLKLEDFLISAPVMRDAKEAEGDAVNADNLFSETGELNLGDGITSQESPSEAKEYKTEDNLNAIDCLNCGKQVTYARLGNGGTKKCPHCKHVNRVVKA